MISIFGHTNKSLIVKIFKKIKKLFPSVSIKLGTEIQNGVKYRSIFIPDNISKEINNELFHACITEYYKIKKSEGKN